MNIILGTKVKIKELSSTNNLHIINYLNKDGVIRGKKNICENYIVPIIEFKDYTRVWIIPEELEIL